MIERLGLLRAALVVVVGLSVGSASTGRAQTPSARPTAGGQHEAANRALVTDFWYQVFDRQDWAKAADYLSVDYVQHNPNVAGGLAGFNAYFSKLWPAPKTSATRTEFVAVLADGDLVQLVMRRPRPDPANPASTYDSYWFDLFRVEGGKIVEHWDPALKPSR